MREVRTPVGNLYELTDVALDRPAHPNLACITVSTGEFSKQADSVDLGDGELDRPRRGGAVYCGICSSGEFCKHPDSVDLSDAELDRPAHPNLACITVSTGEFSKHADSVDLGDGALDGPGQDGAFSRRGLYDGVVELDDAELDRPAHPNLACITVSTGEFSKRADSVDLSDATLDTESLSSGFSGCRNCGCGHVAPYDDLADRALDRPTDVGSQFTGLFPRSVAPHDDLVDTVVDRAGAAGFSSPCCSIKFSGVEDADRS